MVAAIRVLMIMAGACVDAGVDRVYISCLFESTTY